MSTARRRALLATSCGASLTVVTADVPAPAAVRVALGILIVFLLPGFAIVCAVQPSEQLSLGDSLLSSLGISLAMAASTAVFLGATPIGLSRGSVAAVLGGATIMACIYAWFRSAKA
jgi:uncharacterized membrane protein